MPFYLLKGDLVSMKVDAIVNPANVRLLMVEGVGRAIFHKAGDKELADACKKIGYCDPGKAVETPCFNLTNCKILIHAVAPVYTNGKHNEEKLLRSTYKECFKILKSHDYHSIAFPLLSGEFNYPIKEAFDVAQKEILKYLYENKNDVVYIVFFKQYPSLIQDQLQEELTRYIIETNKYSVSKEEKDVATAKDNKELVKTIRKFQKTTNTSDDDLILRGNLSTATFNRLVNDPTYIPSKNCVLGFAIAMKLSEKEIITLLNSLGYNYIKFNLLDLIISFFIDRDMYDVYLINNTLFAYEGLQSLGAEF